MVPIVRDVYQKTVADIEKDIYNYGVMARDGKITPEHMSGGTFTVSNGGIFGSMLSTPIVNPPQSAILGMHATNLRPVVKDGAIVARPMM
jgi:2-oxoglutarate dehydrogenase E2 component (dihydrolipoamide succinyltransferase)